jgi:Xaa-Pro aminopeptidase
MEQRLSRLRNHFDEAGIDALLVFSPENRRYLSGFTGSSGYLLLTGEEALLFTDFRYTEQASAQAPDCRIVKHGPKPFEDIAAYVRKQGIRALGFEQDHVTYATYKRVKNLLQQVSLVPASGLVERLRRCKDEAEIEIIREAAKIADAAFSHILSFLRPGVTEREVALELEMFMRKNGASGSSFETIVASGSRSSLPHGVASDKVLEKGDFVTLDFGAYYKGYCSDLTRTVSLGQPREERLKEIYEIVLQAQTHALSCIRAGMTGKEADALARDWIAERGYGEHFGHSLGHGIGLAIHEDPRLSSLSEDLLEPGMVVTVEPGIYLPNVGGVRIEDDVVITENGLEVLTHSPKELLVLA